LNQKKILFVEIIFKLLPSAVNAVIIQLWSQAIFNQYSLHFSF